MKSAPSILLVALTTATSVLASPATADSTHEPRKPADTVRFIEPTSRSLVFDQAYENLRWRVTGVDYSDDHYEWCKIEVENTRTREFVDADFPDENVNSGIFEIDAWAVAGSYGKHTLSADCYWSGTDRRTVWIRAASRTSVGYVEGERGTAGIAVTRYVDGAWRAAKGTPVLLQRRVDGQWRPVGRKKTDSRFGFATFKAPKGRWRGVAVQTATMAASSAVQRRHI